MQLFKSQGLQEPSRIRVASYREPGYGPHYGHHVEPAASSGPTVAVPDADVPASIVAHERALPRALARYDRAA